MSTNELYEMLTEMVRRGPGHVVAFTLGVGTVAIVLFSVHWLSRRPLQKQISGLHDDNKRLLEMHTRSDVSLQACRAEVDTLRRNLASSSAEVQQLRDTTTRLQTELRLVQDEVIRWRAAAESNQVESRGLLEAKGRLEGQLEVAKSGCQTLQDTVSSLQEEARHLHEDRSRLDTELLGLRQEKDRLVITLTSQSTELAGHREAETELIRQVADLSEQIQELANFDGRVWERGGTGGAPEFIPLSERKTPIIALTNLKGGVGKTTLAANLGAILGVTKRVLLIDLDYQGSLTSLCLPPDQIENIRRRGEFIDRLLRADSTNWEEFERCCHAVPEQPHLRIMAADESLVDVENRNMAQWLLNPRAKDVRHVLRAYLHAPQIAQEYDYVILDCPPRSTTACINAFSAADFVLIPVIPDQTSAEAVPRQLRTLQKLRDTLCPRIDVLGLVANRTSPREQLVAREQAIWDSLQRRCEEPWGGEVYAFRTRIRQKAAFSEAARANRFAACYPDVEPMFRDLADELIRRIAVHERQRTTAVSTEPEPSAQH